MNRRKYPRAALPVLALCLFAAAAMLVSPAASGQKGSRVAEEISQVLESFETLTLDPAAVLSSVRADGSLTLQTARGTFDLVVEPFDVRTDDYRAVAVGEGGLATELPRTPSNSWRGHVRGQEGTFVRLYLDGQKVQGLIITPGETFFVEPARDLSSAAGARDFVFYAASEVKPTKGECVEATLGGKVAAEARRTNVVAATTPPADDAFAPKPQTDIAADADFEFYRDFNGSNEKTTKDDIDAIMTQVDGIYDAQLGIRIRLVFTRVWKTAADPYTQFESGAALNELTSKYQTSFNPNDPDPLNRQPPSRDLVHLFTGKEIDDDVIGIAWTGALCDSPAFSYGLSQSRFSPIMTRRVILTAHEIGHNFGASHTNPLNQPVVPNCDQAANSIMGRAVSASSVTNFCQYSRDEITTHVTGTGGECLTRLTAPGCSYALTPASKVFTTSGGAGTVDIAATAGCNWGVAEGAPWLTFTGPEAGTGNGSTSYTVEPNTGKVGPRRVVADIGGRPLVISQQSSLACLTANNQITIGQTVSAALDSADCTTGQPERLTAFEDVYTFTGRAGQRVRVEMLAALRASDVPEDQELPDAALDCFLYLYGPDGSLIDLNDDRDTGINTHDTDSAIPVAGFLTLPATGVYTVAATSFENNDAGSYTLRLTDNSATNSVSLSSSAYSVDEGTGGGGLGVDGTGFRVVNVTRTGDTTGTATVDYATSDGTASRLKDYEQTLGTLVFAPGEASKTFTVFVNDDAFAEGAETVTLTLSNPVGTTLGASTATLTINSTNDAADGPSPVRAQSFNTAFFVRQQYLDFLNREPDTSGFNFWQGEIDGCGANEQCKEAKRVNVSAAFFVSIEFQETGYLVYRTYKAAYGDATSPNVPGTVPVIRLGEFLPDTQRIGQNVIVGVGNWQAQLDANKQAYALEFVLRPRFLTAFPVSMTPAQYVDKLVQNAGITLTTPERDALVAQFGATADVAAARAAVLRAVSENAQLRQNEFRRAFVLMEYYGYLRRNPDDAPEAGLNFGGWKFWLDKLNEFGGDYVRAEMVKAYLTSDEYIDRFGTRP
jgi:hypothetical protein